MSNPIDDLLEVMAQLRHQEHGCAWDKAQTFASLVPHTLEEAYEVADCIERDDIQNLPSELGDLLFQVVFYARIAEERDLFDFADVVNAISQKLRRRHPHVFDKREDLSAAEQTERWEALKAMERRGRDKEDQSALADVPVNLPALVRAQKLQRRAARVGFDWPSAAGPRAKIDEELRELDSARKADDESAISDEFGDLLFSCVNMGRFLGLDAERALRLATHKFEARFRRLEDELRGEGLDIDKQSLEALESRWQSIKLTQKKRAPKHP